MRILQTGLTVHDRAKATQGYTLYTPLFGNRTYLMDMDANTVHEWELPDRPAGYARLLPNGNLFYASYLEGGPPLKAGAKGGLIREVDWDGNVVFEHIDLAQHHDVRRLANGNIVYSCWEKMAPDTAARVSGGLEGSEMEDGSMWSDLVREVSPDGDTVWQWRFAEDVELARYTLHPLAKRAVVPWCNAVVPLDGGDVLICLRLLNMVAIIDRQTKGFKWQRQQMDWGLPHDCQILENGNMMLFANGMNSTDAHSHSRIVEFDPETGEEAWVYRADPLNHFYSHHISGAQRLWSGNTLICEGSFGRLFEVTPDGEIVWEFINPRFDKNIDGATVNWVFRSYRYPADSPEIGGRV
ncbi:MAG: aryl sulfotransferase [Alphaproteobacteria bacterium]|nr:aryl sulfotransferase [Alphaproteobacteria bacterium]